MNTHDGNSKQELLLADQAVSAVEVDRRQSSGNVSWPPRNVRFEPKQPTLGASLLSYLEVPFVHWKLIATCGVLSVIVAWLAILAWPRAYESEAKLLIRIGHESVGLDPTATTSQTLVMEKTLEQEVNSSLEVLGSRKLAQRVVETLGEDSILDGVVPSSDAAGGESAAPEQSRFGELVTSAVKTAKSTLNSVLLTTGIRDDIGTHELAIREVQGTVSIYAPRESNVVSIHAVSRTPEMAQLLAKTVTEEYLEQHLDVSHTSGAQEFFQQQVAASEQQLAELLDKRSKFKQEHRIVSIDANLDMLTNQMAAIETEKLAARSQLQQAEAEMLDLRRRLAETDDEIVSEKEEVFDETWSGMRQKVYELEVEEKSLAAKYTNDYVPLQQVREQLEGAREILAKMQSDRVNSSTTLNPVKLKLQSDLQQLETRVAGLNAMMDKKAAQESELSLRVNELHRLEQQLTEMDRDARVREESLVGLRKKLEEARIIDELLSERISSVNVLQPATFVERAASPNKKMLAVGTVFLALMGGIGLAFLRELNSPTIRTETQVESLLGTPVVAKIASIPSLTGTNAIDIEKLQPLRSICRDVASQILMSAPNRRGEGGISIGVVSMESGGGASTLATALALTCSEDCGLKTTLVDADTRQRTVSTAFGLNGSPGLVELAAGDAAHVDCVQHRDGFELSLISCCSSHSKRRLSSSPKGIHAAIDRFQETDDVVIVDLPSASRPDHAMHMAQHLDYLLVVIESEKAEQNRVSRLFRQLGLSDGQLIGTVLNKQREYVPGLIRKVFVPRVG